MAGTCEEARAHLGLATPRPWKVRALARPTPARLRLDSLITLPAHQRIEQGATCMRNTAWDRKAHPTFADTLAWVRRQVWDHRHVAMSQQETGMLQIPRALFERF